MEYEEFEDGMWRIWKCWLLCGKWWHHKEATNDLSVSSQSVIRAAYQQHTPARGKICNSFFAKLTKAFRLTGDMRLVGEHQSESLILLSKYPHWVFLYTSVICVHRSMIVWSRTKANFGDLFYQTSRHMNLDKYTGRVADRPSWSDSLYIKNYMRWVESKLKPFK